MAITYDDFKKLKIQVAKVISVEPILGKTRIVKGIIELENNKTRDVIIGGAEYYSVDELIGKTVIAVTNLEPKKMAGIESTAMLLAADVNDKPYWLNVDNSVPLGSPIL